MVGKWYKKEGSAVEKNEPLVEVISEKATYDLEAPASGILRKILVKEGEMADVDRVLALVVAQDEEIPDSLLAEVAAAGSTEPEEKRALASPAAKRLARELNVDLLLVEGSGPEGRINEDDVQRFSDQSRGLQPRVKQVIQLSGFRKTSAERVTTSFRTAPHSTIVMSVDVSEATVLHKKLGVSYTAIIIKSAAIALTKHSMVNSTLVGDQVRIFEDVNVGVATATEHGLVVPVIRSADMITLQEIDARLNDLSEKARAGKLTKEELSDGTFTITNLGMYDVEFFTPIINPPEAAILGVGAINEKLVMSGGKVEVRRVMMLSLSYDHRIIDGAPAAEFLREVKAEIEKRLES
jgi:pyruvate dehydrogenase E2 component (dihydrolipoamide acetyltransferase)